MIAAVLTFFAVSLGGRPADLEHPYGHRRAENLGALGEAAMLLGRRRARRASRRSPASPASAGATTVHWYQFAVIGVALILEAARMAVSLRRRAAAYYSAALRSNALHFAGDMAGSLRCSRAARRAGGLRTTATRSRRCSSRRSSSSPRCA